MVELLAPVDHSVFLVKAYMLRLEMSQSLSPSQCKLTTIEGEVYVVRHDISTANDKR